MTNATAANPAFVSVILERCPASAGFTLVEMVMVVVLIGILSAFVAPRLTHSSEFAARGFEDQVKATLRYAQKAAIAQRRYVCVAFMVDSVELSVNEVPSCPGTALVSAGGNVVTRVEALPDIGFAAVPSGFYFDALGRPGTDVTRHMRVLGMSHDIVVEADTGYVH